MTVYSVLRTCRQNNFLQQRIRYINTFYEQTTRQLSYLETCNFSKSHRTALPSPSDNDWFISNGELLLGWMHSLPVLIAILELMSCHCSTNCLTGRCSCFQNQMPCTEFHVHIRRVLKTKDSSDNEVDICSILEDIMS